MLSLRNINDDNFVEVIKLSDTLDETQKKSVAPNVVSIAQAYVNFDVAWPKAIYLNDQVIGFMMLKTTDSDIPEEDQKGYYLWRFMISKDYQGKGYGKQALNLLVDKCKKDHVKSLYVSCTMHSDMPYKFYIGYGFEDLNFMDGNEEILRLYI